MATIRITRDTLIKGVPAFDGDVVEVDDAEARLLIGYRQAEPFVEAEDEEDTVDDEDDTVTGIITVDDDLSTTPTKKKRR